MVVLSNIQSEMYSELLSDKEKEFALRLLNISKEHLQSEVLNRVESRRPDAASLVDDLAKWGKRYADDNYVCIRYIRYIVNYRKCWL